MTVVDLSKMASGFCDRLRVVTFGAAVAFARKEAELLLRNERLMAVCPYRILDYCRIQGLDCRVTDDASPADFLMSSRESFPSRKWAEQFAPADLGVDPDRMLALWLAAYQALVPTERIAGCVATTGVGPDCLGVHVRLTDKVRQGERPKAENACRRLARYAIDYLKSRGLKRAFLASDERAGRDYMVGALRREGVETLIASADFDSGKLRQTDGEAFATDLFALARCRDVVGNVWSGVSFTAARMNGKRVLHLASDADD